MRSLGVKKAKKKKKEKKRKKLPEKLNDFVVFAFISSSVKPGFHIVVSVVSVVSVVRKKFIGQIKLNGNLPYKCSIQTK